MTGDITPKQMSEYLRGHQWAYFTDDDVVEDDKPVLAAAMIDELQTTRIYNAIPYGSTEAYSQASEMIARGQRAFKTPEGNEKPKGKTPIDELCWEIGHTVGRQLKELEDAHAIIPEDVAPISDTTSGDRTKLAERIVTYAAAQLDDGK